MEEKFQVTTYKYRLNILWAYMGENSFSGGLKVRLSTKMQASQWAAGSLKVREERE